MNRTDNASALHVVATAEAIRGLAHEFGWAVAQRAVNAETVLLSPLEGDPPFTRFVWVIDGGRSMLRCLFVTAPIWEGDAVPKALRLAALVNHGLPFGCLEYNFAEDVLVFRDAIDLDWGEPGALVSTVTSRVLQLGRRYRTAVQAVYDGRLDPDDAVAAAEREAR